VADTWAIPGVLLVYNDAGRLHAVNLSALSGDDDQSRLGSRQSVVLHRANSRIDAIGISTNTCRLA